MSLVVFEKVCLGFGKKTIVNELDLRIGEGERIGLRFGSGLRASQTR